MFPAAKKRKSSEKPHGPLKKQKFSNSKPRKGAMSPNKSGRGDKSEKGRKTFGGKKWQHGKNTKPEGQAFRTKKFGDRDNKFGGKKKFLGKKNDSTSKSRSQKFKPGLKKQGFKQRKGKG